MGIGEKLPVNPGTKRSGSGFGKYQRPETAEVDPLPVSEWRVGVRAEVGVGANQTPRSFSHLWAEKVQLDLFYYTGTLLSLCVLL